MRLMSFTDYGLRMLMRMASEPGRVFSTAELSGEFGLPRNHLIKIIQRLSRGGLVETRRGSGGGAVMARDPDTIRIGDVVRLLEEGQAMVQCFSAGNGLCTIESCCRLKVRLRSAETAFLNELNRSTLADIAFAPSERTAA